MGGSAFFCSDLRSENGIHVSNLGRGQECQGRWGCCEHRHTSVHVCAGVGVYFSFQPLKCTKAFCSLTSTLTMRDGCHLQASPARADAGTHAHLSPFQSRRDLPAAITRTPRAAQTTHSAGEHSAGGQGAEGGWAETCRLARRTPCTCALPGCTRPSARARAAAARTPAARRRDRHAAALSSPRARRSS